MRIEMTKEAHISAEVAIWDEGQALALRVTVGPDGIERFIDEQNRSAIELSSDIAAAIRALGSTLKHILSMSDQDG